MEAESRMCEDENGGGLQINTALGAHPDGETVGTTCAEKRKKRRGKSKRKIMKSYVKMPSHDCKNKYCGKNQKERTKSRAPYNNNQFLMEEHMPGSKNILCGRTPARTRDSSFSVDSDENYFYSLPEDEEAFLTREFSSVYEDAQSERLTTMSKTELIREYLDLEVKFETVTKRLQIKAIDCDDAGNTTVEKLLEKIRQQDLEIQRLKAKNVSLCRSRVDSSLCDCSSECDSSSNNSVAPQNQTEGPDTTVQMDKVIVEPPASNPEEPA